MKVVAVHGSPNVGGLTESLARAVLEGAAQVGARTEMIRLTDRHLESCRQCGNGWGQCREKGTCVIEDDFAAIREAVLTADGWALVTPVYYWDLSESVKVFTDRLRRCNSGAKGAGLAAKPFIGIAAAGGSGNGIAQCLVHLDQFIKHVGGEIADLITVTRRSRDYKIEAARAAGRALVEALSAQAAQPR